MAIKFDELLEALDPSLDEFEEDLNSMWIIIPTERRYDDLTADDYFKFARKYGTFDNQKDCFDKIEELAPDRWDAFIPMKLEGVNESLNEDYLDPYIDELAEPLSKYMQMSSKHFNAVCDYIDDELRKPGKGLSELSKRDLETLYSVFIEQDNDSYLESLNEALKDTIIKSYDTPFGTFIIKTREGKSRRTNYMTGKKEWMPVKSTSGYFKDFPLAAEFFLYRDGQDRYVSSSQGRESDEWVEFLGVDNYDKALHKINKAVVKCFQDYYGDNSIW